MLGFRCKEGPIQFNVSLCNTFGIMLEGSSLGNSHLPHHLTSGTGTFNLSLFELEHPISYLVNGCRESKGVGVQFKWMGEGLRYHHHWDNNNNWHGVKRVRRLPMSVDTTLSLIWCYWRHSEGSISRVFKQSQRQSTMYYLQHVLSSNIRCKHRWLTIQSAYHQSHCSHVRWCPLSARALLSLSL